MAMTSAWTWQGSIRMILSRTCGPEHFMLEMFDYLKAQDVAASRLKFEIYFPGDLVMKSC